MTIDPFLLRGASLGAAWRADRGGAAGAVYHAAGAGPLPIASGLPIVATLLDLAPWELPEAFGRTPAARFGQRLRGRLLRDAAAVVVAGPAVKAAARRLLHIRPDRIRVIPLAPRAAFAPAPGRGASGRTVAGDDDAAAERERLGLTGRYLVYPGRYDARQDLATLLRALASLAEAGRPSDLPDDVAWPPRILLLGASPEDRASLARAAARQGIGDCLAYAPALATTTAAGLLRGARAAILPVVSEAAGLAAIEALACGTPVVASAVGDPAGDRRRCRGPRGGARPGPAGHGPAHDLGRGPRPRTPGRRRETARDERPANLGGGGGRDARGLRGGRAPPGLRRASPDRSGPGGQDDALGAALPLGDGEAVGTLPSLIEIE